MVVYAAASRPLSPPLRSAHSAGVGPASGPAPDENTVHVTAAQLGAGAVTMAGLYLALLSSSMPWSAIASDADSGSAASPLAVSDMVVGLVLIVLGHVGWTANSEGSRRAGWAAAVLGVWIALAPVAPGGPTIGWATVLGSATAGVAVLAAALTMIVTGQPRRRKNRTSLNTGKHGPGNPPTPGTPAPPPPLAAPASRCLTRAADLAHHDHRRRPVPSPHRGAAT